MELNLARIWTMSLGLGLLKMVDFTPPGQQCIQVHTHKTKESSWLTVIDTSTRLLDIQEISSHSYMCAIPRSCYLVVR